MHITINFSDTSNKWELAGINVDLNEITVKYIGHNYNIPNMIISSYDGFIINHLYNYSF